MERYYYFILIDTKFLYVLDIEVYLVQFQMLNVLKLFQVVLSIVL